MENNVINDKEVKRIEVPIVDRISKFDEFIQLENNHRILFSGAFGSGKTYFLNKFFAQKTDEYEVFYISPVNYCISNNEDILKLLQYDLLVEIMLKNLPDFKDGFSDFTNFKYFVYFNWLNIVKDAVSHCGTVGKKLSDVWSTYVEWSDKFKKFSNEVNKSLTDEVKILTQSFAEELEFNQHTELIYNIISSIDKKKKSVLIIDDLDRIDPEHIFRLLNIFSTQLSDYFSSHSFAENEKNNKFGFNKVIFVCDIDNIRNIFHAKYGQNTDFSGYIDKFYSIEPYVWDNKEELLEVVHMYVNSVKSELSIVGQRDLLYSIIRVLVKYNIINLRKLVVKEDKKWVWPGRKIPVLTNDINRYSAEIVDFILFIFGSKEDAISSLKKHTEEIDVETINKVLVYLIPLLDTNNYKHLKNGQEIAYRNKDLNTRIVVGVKSDATGRNPSLSKVTYWNDEEKKLVPFFQLLAIAIEKYYNIINF